MMFLGRYDMVETLGVETRDDEWVNCLNVGRTSAKDEEKRSK